LFRRNKDGSEMDLCWSVKYQICYQLCCWACRQS